MPRRVLKALAPVVLATALCAHAAWTQEAGKIDQEAAEFVAELIGRPVFASDGKEVGTVVDLSVDEEGVPRKLRMKTARDLGIGTRTVEVPNTSFMTLRGAVVLDLPASAIVLLPDVRSDDEER